MFLELPDPLNDLYMEPAAWRTAVALRLGQALFSGQQHCPICARRSNDVAPLIEKDARHALICKYEDGQTRRHNVLRDFLQYRVFKKLGVSVLPEQRLHDGVDSNGIIRAVSLHERIRQNRRRPPRATTEEGLRIDLFIPSAYGFAPRDQAIDVTVSHPHTSAHIAQASVTGGAAATLAERQKHTNYGDVCKTNQIELVPVGVDVFGAIGREAEAFFRHVATFTADRRGTSCKKEFQQLLARYSMRMQAMQARQINVRRTS